MLRENGINHCAVAISNITELNSASSRAESNTLFEECAGNCHKTAEKLENKRE
jgi:hypothetical protein